MLIQIKQKSNMANQKSTINLNKFKAMEFHDNVFIECYCYITFFAEVTSPEDAAYYAVPAHIFQD